MMPRSAFATSLSALANNTLNMLSTSSPTYPASVKLVASATINGTLRYFATVCASKVLPHPVGPNNRTLPLCIVKPFGGGLNTRL